MWYLITRLTTNILQKLWRTEHERSLAAYMKFSKKREGDKGHQEAIDDLYVARKKFHQVAHYFNCVTAIVS